MYHCGEATWSFHTAVHCGLRLGGGGGPGVGVMRARVSMLHARMHAHAAHVCMQAAGGCQGAPEDGGVLQVSV